MRSPSATSRSARSRSRPPARAITASAPSQCVAVSSHAKRDAACAAGPHRPLHRLRGVARRAGQPVVERERGGLALALDLRDRRGRARVQAPAPRRAEARVERVADERVRERVRRAVRLLGLDDELRVARLLERGDQLVLLDRRRRQEHVERALPAEHRRGRERGAARVREPGEAPREHLLHALGHADLVRRERRRPAPAALEHDPALDQVAEHLLDEERVAVRVLVHGADERRRAPRAPRARRSARRRRARPAPRARSAPPAGRAGGRRAAPRAGATGRTSASR